MFATVISRGLFRHVKANEGDVVDADGRCTAETSMMILGRVGRQMVIEEEGEEESRQNAPMGSGNSNRGQWVLLSILKR